MQFFVNVSRKIFCGQGGRQGRKEARKKGGKEERKKGRKEERKGGREEGWVTIQKVEVHLCIRNPSPKQPDLSPAG